MLYYSFQKKFTVPRAELFVAPRSVNRNLQALFNSPSSFKKHMIDTWTQYCENGITDKETIPMTPELRAHIENFDFSTARHISLAQMLQSVTVRR